MVRGTQPQHVTFCSINGNVYQELYPSSETLVEIMGIITVYKYTKHTRLRERNNYVVSIYV